MQIPQTVESEILMAVMTSGIYDEQCSIKIGDKVKKVLDEDLGNEEHSVGDIGEVIGNINHEEAGPAYLVDFGDGKNTFIIEKKISKL